MKFPLGINLINSFNIANLSFLVLNFILLERPWFFDHIFLYYIILPLKKHSYPHDWIYPIPWCHLLIVQLPWWSVPGSVLCCHFIWAWSDTACVSIIQDIGSPKYNPFIIPTTSQRECRYIHCQKNKIIPLGNYKYTRSLKMMQDITFPIKSALNPEILPQVDA